MIYICLKCQLFFGHIGLYNHHNVYFHQIHARGKMGYNVVQVSDYNSDRSIGKMKEQNWIYQSTCCE